MQTSLRFCYAFCLISISALILAARIPADSDHPSQAPQIAPSATPAGDARAIVTIPWQNSLPPHTARTPAEVAVDLTLLNQRADSRHVVIQFNEALTDELKTDLAKSGVTLLAYLGNNAFFAGLSRDALDAAALGNVPSLVFAGEISNPMKLHPAFVNNTIPAYAVVARQGESDPQVAAYLIFHPDVDFARDGLPLMDKLGVEVRDVIPAVNGLVIEFPLHVLNTLAADDGVQWIEPPLPPFSEWNDSNRTRVGANTAQAAPYNLTGSGVTVLVYDAGTARSTHQDFGGRLTVHDSSGLLAHSTHVSGTIGGSGAASGGTFKGMAPGVTMHSYGFQYDGTGIFLYSNPGDMNADYSQAVNTFGAVISSNSIGSNVETNGFDCAIQGNYGVTDQLIDNMVRGSLGAPFRVVWAAGNERQGNRCDVEGFGDYYSVPPPATAKNHITVGALNSNDDTMTSFSSWGPTDDGRMKPDVAGPGCQSNGDFGVTSCTSSSDTAYTAMCGTSMACPTVAGCCALLLQDYRAHFGGGDPRNSTLKIFLAHTAVDLGNVGPDYQFGYGSVRIVSAIDFERLGFFAESQVSTSGIVSYNINVAAATPQLKVTLAWDDAAGTPNVNPAQVNDLDLRVFDPSNNQRFPWTLNPSNPSAAAVQTTRNSIDNIEQVVVNSPVAGTWRVEVFGFNVPQGPQPFSVCASPNLSACSTAPAAPTGVAATDTNCGSVSVSWTAVSGATGYQVWRNTVNNSATATQIGTPASSPFTDSTATPGQTYFYWVKATNSCGTSGFSTPDSGLATTVPAAPTGVTASDATSCTSVTVSWTAVTGATGYQVWRNTTNNSATATQIGTPAASPFTDSTATPGQAYFYWVKATNACGASAFSAADAGSANTVPAAPTGVTASDGTSCTSVTVSWTAVTGATGYQVWRNTVNNSATATQIGTPAASPFTDNTATPGQTYFYWVKATNACGASAFSASDSGVANSVPAAPTGVTASDATSCTSVTVAWTAVTGATGYQVWRNTVNNSATATQIGTPAASPFTDSTATPGQGYFYWVKATNTCGASAFSTADSGSANAVPAAPTGVTASDATSCTSVAVSWTAVTGATGYQVWRNTVNDTASATQIGTPASSPFTDNTATPGQTYFYWVKATNTCGAGAFSTPDTGSANAAPAAPTGVAASDATSCTSVAVSWTAVTGATGYQVWRNTLNNSGTATQIGTPAASPFTDNTATPGQTYFYWVKATNTCGASPFSAADTGSADTVPAAPTGVTASDATSCTSVTVSWTAVTGATGYQVWRNTLNDTASATQIGTPASSPFTDNTATPGQSYFYWVKATNTCGASVFSTADTGSANAAPAAPTGVAASDATSCTSVTVTWNAVSGATGYQVWRNTVNNSATATQIGTPAASPFADNTATPGQTYFYWVKATNSCGASAFSTADSGSADAAPSAPTGVTASDATSCASVTISWTVSGATGYQVWRNTVNNSGTATQIGTPASSPFTDFTATPGQTYFYWVKATNTCGASPFSAPDSGSRNTAPAAPAGVAATDATSCTVVTVSWTAVGGAAGYEVWRNTANDSATATQIGTPGSSPFDDATATPGQTYFYWVKATNTCGASPFSTPDSGVRADVPAAPGNVAATDTNCSEVTVSWDAVAVATGYQVWRNVTNDSSSATQIGTPGASPFHDGTALAGQTYFYWVKATNSCGASLFSAPDSGTRGSVTAAPVNLIASDAGCDDITLIWDVVSGATGYQVWRNTTNDSATATQIGTPSASPFHDTTATAGQTYFYWVTATDSCGASAFSNPDSGLRGAAPGAPTNVAATDTGCTDVTVSWDNVAGAAGYEVWRNTSNDSASATQIGTPAASPFSDSTASPGQGYFYWVKATNACGTSAFSAPDSGVRGGAPTAPLNVAASDNDCNAVTVSWDAVGGATGYEVWRNTLDDSSTAALIGTPGASPFADNTAATGQVYFYWVKAIDACGTSGFSASDSGARTDVPAAPLNVSATDTGCGDITVSWDVVSGATGYQVWRNTTNDSATATQIGTPASSPFHDAGASAGQTYFYWVKATNECGAGAFSESDSGQRGTTPAAPANVAASDSDCNDVAVSWDPVGGASGYEVWRNTVNDSSTATQIGSPSASPFHDATAVAGQTYFYWVRALDLCGPSPFSNPDTGVRGTSAAAPTNVAATDAGCSDVTVSWNAVSGATGYEVWRNTTNNSATATLIGTPAASPFTDSTAVSGQAYFYWVKAVNACGTSPFSTPDSGQRGTAPPAPANIAASDGGCNEITVTWDAVGGASGYEIWRNTADDSSGATQIGTPAASPFSDFATTAGVTYFYWVKATNDCGVSPFSSSDNGVRGDSAAAPTGVAASDNLCDRVTVSWSAVVDATDYQVWRNTVNDSGSSAQVGSAAASPFDDTTGTVGTTYYYWVTATNACGTSPFSTTDSGRRFCTLLGDMNCDGAVNNFDITPFVLALTNPAGYAAAYPNCNLMNGDINHDGALNNFDIDGFVACLTHGCP